MEQDKYKTKKGIIESVHFSVGTGAEIFLIPIKNFSYVPFLKLIGLHNTHASQTITYEIGVKQEGIYYPIKSGAALAAGGFGLQDLQSICVEYGDFYCSCLASGASTTGKMYVMYDAYFRL